MPNIAAATTPASLAVSLLPHPASPAPAGAVVSVELGRAGSVLRLDYHLSVPGLRSAPPASPARLDNLWQHTCCEFFVGEAGCDAYREFNFSPSGAWAAYDFSAYRKPAAALPAGPAPSISVRSSPGGLALAVELADTWLVLTSPLRIGLSVVTETDDGTLAYWALHHPSPRPDFHDAATRTLTLETSA